MSGVMHPVGPEPTRVYWARRAVVIGVLLVVVAVISSLVASATGGQQPVSAVPAVTPGQTVRPTSTSTPSSSTSGSGSSPSASPTRSPKASVKPTATRTTSSAKPTADPTAKTKAPAKAKKTPAKAKKTPAKAKAPAKKAKAKKAPPVAAPCDPAELRATLTGKQRLAPEEDNTFALSLINGSSAVCRVIVTAANFELKIYSGKDRIWSSDDCSTAVKTIKQDVASEKAYGWSMTWNGLRSAQDCKNRDEIPRAGTYFATAQLTGAKPVQLRMILS